MLKTIRFFKWAWIAFLILSAIVFTAFMAGMSLLVVGWLFNVGPYAYVFH